MKHTVKRLSILAVLLVICTSLFAFEVDGINYEITSSSTVKVTAYGRYSGDIVIPESVDYNGNTYSVTSIGWGAFSDCGNLSSVTIGNSVTTIENEAFQYCRRLPSVTIPNSVTTIGNNAFTGCSSLKSVTIGNSVMSIGGSAFSGCSSLASVTILCPNVGSWFHSMTSIKEVILGDNVKSIEGLAFEGCRSLESVTIPNSVTSIGGSAFSDCRNLASVTIGNGVTSIGDLAFENCISLASVTIPNSVTSIGWGAFRYCSRLASVTIGNGVTSIGIEVFYNCNALASVTILCPNVGTCFMGMTSIKEVVLGDSVTTIGNSAFSGCGRLESVTIGNSVTTIGWRAFSLCSSLASVTIGNSVTTIEDWAFDGCSSLESVTIPNSVTSIGSYAFNYCSSLKSVTIGNSVTSIGDHVFFYCSSLESVTIGNSVTTIEYCAFYNCSSLASVTIPNSVTSIGWDAFSGCSSLTSMTIGNSVATIENGAFKGCSSLESVTIPNSVTSIGGSAFSDCRKLASVTIGNSVTTIGDYAFYNCSSLESVTIPNSATSIGDSPFSCCSSLASVTILCPNVGLWFQGMTSIKKVVLGDSVTTIGNYAFYDCSSLESVTIGNSVTSIGYKAIPYYTFIKLLGAVPPKLDGDSYYSRESTFLKIEVPKGSSFRYALAENWQKTDTIYSMDGNTRLYPIPIYKNMSVVTTNGNSEGTEAAENEEVEVTSINNEYLPYSLIMKGNCEITNTIVNNGKYVFKASSNHKENTISCYSYPYRDISLSASGTLIDQIGIDNISSIECLKVSGDINGTDILTIRKMKNLKLLDLSDAHIVNGGMSYYKNYTTSENTIGDFFYEGLNSLQRIVLPQDIHTITYKAFENCYKILTISVPKSVKNIGSCWLSNMYNLQSLQIEDLEAWCRIKMTSGYYQQYREFHLFLNDNEVFDLIIPNGIETLNQFSFIGCSWLKSITLPASLTNISHSAFSSCNRLTSVTSLNPIPPQIKNEVFNDLTYENATLYVPKGSKTLYWLHPYWEKFKKIEEIEVNEELAEQQALALESYQGGMTFYNSFMGFDESVRNAYEKLVEQQKLNNEIGSELYDGIRALINLITESSIDENIKQDFYARLSRVNNDREYYVNKTNEIDYNYLMTDLDNAKAEFASYSERLNGYKQRIESATSVSEIEAIIEQMDKDKADMENNYLNPLNTEYNSLLQSFEDCKGYEEELSKLKEELVIVKDLYWREEQKNEVRKIIDEGVVLSEIYYSQTREIRNKIDETREYGEVLAPKFGGEATYKIKQLNKKVNESNLSDETKTVYNTKLDSLQARVEYLEKYSYPFNSYYFIDILNDEDADFTAFQLDLDNYKNKLESASTPKEIESISTEISNLINRQWGEYNAFMDLFNIYKAAIDDEFENIKANVDELINIVKLLESMSSEIDSLSGIEQILMSNPNAVINAYTMQGIKLQITAKDVSNLPKGVYIINGKKVFIK